MSADREVWFTDRWGADVEDDITIEAFAALFDELRVDDDPEHCVVDISDSGDWFVEFSRTDVCFQQAERGGEVVGDLEYADRDEALQIAKEFIDGDFAALRARPWKP